MSGNTQSNCEWNFRNFAKHEIKLWAEITEWTIAISQNTKSKFSAKFLQFCRIWINLYYIFKSYTITFVVQSFFSSNLNRFESRSFGFTPHSSPLTPYPPPLTPYPSPLTPHSPLPSHHSHLTFQPLTFQPPTPRHPHPPQPSFLLAHPSSLIPQPSPLNLQPLN